MKKIIALLLLSLMSLSLPSYSDGLSCKRTSEKEIQELFTRWNDSLLAGDYHKVVSENYALDSILLPTVSSVPRVSVASKEDYFHHFLESEPSGKITFSHIQIGCNSAIDSGLYTFTFAKPRDGSPSTVHARYTYTYIWTGKKWLISSHHSSVNPTEIEAQIYKSL